jgi:hypothetical protein
VRVPGLSKLAAHVFFGRGSFPDVEPEILSKTENLNAPLAAK